MHQFSCRLLALLMPVVLACSTAAIAQAPPSAPPAVAVAKPIVKEVVERDDYVGRFEAVDAVEIRARVSGYLQTVSFRDGAIVKLGDPLFTIDKRPYQAALDQAEAAVTSAQARVAFAQSDYERAAALGRTGNITEQLLEQRRNTLETARGDLLGAQAAARTARLNLGFTEIHAPMAGRIGRKLISEGNLVTADQTLLTTIVSLDPIYFYFDVDERSFLAYQRTLQIGTVSDANQNRLPVRVALTDEKVFNRKGVLDFLDNRVDQATRHDAGAGLDREQGSVHQAGPVRHDRGAGVALLSRRPDPRRGDRHRPGPAHRLGRCR